MMDWIETNPDKAYWQKYYGGVDAYLRMPIHQTIVNFLASHYPLACARVIDLGGGPGAHATLLRDLYGSEIVNIDASVHAQAYLQHKVQQINQDLTEPWKILGWNRESVDVLYSIQALEHIEANKIDFVVQEIYSWLKPGGLCFISIAREDNIADETHACLEPKAWWYTEFLCRGFRHDWRREWLCDPKLPCKDWQCLYLEKPCLRN